MIKELAWNTFKNTGDINTFLEIIELKNIEENLSEPFLKTDLEKDIYGNNKNNWYNSIRK